ncbi:MAG: hypothetical protein ACLR0U_16835 [Enterocloster clostridioformis]
MILAQNVKISAQEKQLMTKAGTRTRFLTARTCSNDFFACHILSAADCGKDLKITGIKEIQSPVGPLIFDNRAGNFCQLLLTAAVVIRQSPLAICMESFEEESALLGIPLEPIVKTPFSKTLLISFPTA